MNHSSQMTRDEVLYAFAVEDEADRDTLLRYLTAYPQFANDLIDLSRELNRSFSDDLLSASDAKSLDVAIACDHCFILAMQRCQKQSPAAFELWRNQEFERCERIKSESGKICLAEPPKLEPESHYPS